MVTISIRNTIVSRERAMFKNVKYFNKIEMVTQPLYGGLV